MISQTLQDINSLIILRGFLTNNLDNVAVKMDRPTVNGLRNKITAIDKKVIELAIDLDVSLVGKEPSMKTTIDIPAGSIEKITRSFKATEDVFDGIDMDKKTPVDPVAIAELDERMGYKTTTESDKQTAEKIKKAKSR